MGFSKQALIKAYCLDISTAVNEYSLWSLEYVDQQLKAYTQTFYLEGMNGLSFSQKAGVGRLLQTGLARTACILDPIPLAIEA